MNDYNLENGKSVSLDYPTILVLCSHGLINIDKDCIIHSGRSPYPETMGCENCQVYQKCQDYNKTHQPRCILTKEFDTQ